MSFSLSDRGLLSHAPAHTPSIIVARVGVKLRVDQPPSLKRKGDSRGKRFRNQVSNAQAALLIRLVAHYPDTVKRLAAV